MLSPDENVENKKRSGSDFEPNYRSYLGAIKLLFGIEIVILILMVLQTLFFYRLYYVWDLLYIYDGILSLAQIEFNIGAIVFIIWTIQISHAAIAFTLIKRLKKIIKTEQHSYKYNRWLFFLQLVVLNLIPSFFNLGITLLLLLIGAQIWKTHRAT